MSSRTLSSGEITEAKNNLKDVPDSEEDKSSGGENEAENEDDRRFQKAKQALTCRKVTLNTLLDEEIITPGKGVLSIDYLGQRFEADLLENGKINWHGSEELFRTPTAWVLHCKRLVNPQNKRSGCGWASVKYKGKSLDIWKSTWARKHRISPIKPPPSSTLLSTSTLTSLVTSCPSASTTSTKPASTLPFKGPSSLSHSAIHPMNVTTPALTLFSTGVMATVLSSTTTTTAPTESMMVSLNTPSSTLLSSLSSAINASTSTIPLISPNAISVSGLLNSNPNQTTSSSGSSSKSLSMLLSTPPSEAMSTFHPIGHVNTPELLKDNLISKECVKDAFSNSNLISKTKFMTAQGQELTGIRDTPMTLSSSLYDQSHLGVISPAKPMGAKRPITALQSSMTESNVTRSNKERKCLRYLDIETRTSDIDMNTLIQCEHFDKHKKLQPFSVLVSTNALLLMDFHCHLTTSEVIGYLGGRWDSVKQILTIDQSFPILCRFADKVQAPLVEEEICRRMRSRKLMVVGWYHSHPYCRPQPTLRDVDCQMAYQLQMRGAGSSYHPCIGFILAPNEKQENYLQGFWAMPNLEHTATMNIPMHISYSVRRDLSLTEDVLIDMKLLSEYYSGAPDKVSFRDRWKDEMSYLDKLRASLATKLPEDQIHSGTFLDYMQQLLGEMK